MKLSSVKHYCKENLQNLDFNLSRTKQPFDLSNTITIFSQFSENVCQKAKKFQASDITSLRLHNRQELKKKQRTKFCLESLLNFNHSQKSKLLALSISTHSVLKRPLAQKQYLKMFQLHLHSQQIPHRHCLKQSKNQSYIFHVHIKYAAYYIQYKKKGSKSLHLKSTLHRGSQTQLHFGRILQVNTQSSRHLLRFKTLMATH